MRKILFFALLSSLTFGQNKKIDSLKNELKKNKSDKFLDYKNLTLEYYNSGSSPEELEKYTKIMIDYAQKKNNNSYIAISKSILALIYSSKQDYKNAYLILGESLRYAEKSNDNYTLGRINYIYSRVYFLENNNSEAIRYGIKAINYLNKSTPSQEIDNTLFNIYTALTDSYTSLGLYDLAQESLNNGKRYLNKVNNEINYFQINQAQSLLFSRMKHFDKAIAVQKQNLKITKTKTFKTQNKNGLIYSILYEVSSLYFNKGDFTASKKYIDSTKFYNNSIPEDFKNYIIAPTLSLEADIALKEKKYEECKKLNDQSKRLAIINQDAKAEAESYLRLGSLYYETKEYANSIKYFESAKKLSVINNLTYLKEELLSYLIKLYSITNQSDKFLNAFKEYNELQTQIFNEQTANSLVASQIKYETELKEAQIKSQQLELEKEKTNRNVAISGVGFLLLLSGGGFWFFKNRQKQKELQNQNTLLGLQQNLNAMELQSLNKQLDPHEIKNLLASISPEIQEKAPESYKRMLKLFNVTKASLNNHSLTESIEIQTQQIEDFLSLEKSMLTVPFEYFIENTIQNKDLQIPRLMLKNLVENAIKHGIKGTESGGKVEVSLFEKNNFITITVDDSGKGRQQAILSDSGIGTSTYQKLFATLNQKNKENATFEIIDKEQGTKVEVRIPQDYKYN